MPHGSESPPSLRILSLPAKDLLAIIYQEKNKANGVALHKFSLHKIGKIKIGL